MESNFIGVLSEQMETWTEEGRALYRSLVRSYYEKLPAKSRPEKWPGIQEELRERDAIQAHEREVHRNRSIFTRTP